MIDFFFGFGWDKRIIMIILVFLQGMEAYAKQPIQFNHKKHKENQISCDVCHQDFVEKPQAGRPNLKTCLLCHASPLTSSPEEEKIREYAKRKEEPPWQRLYLLPPDIYFSHFCHVIKAKLKCQTCHGTIGESENPPSRPAISLKMGWCLSCHQKMKAETDCLACHK